MILRDIPCDRRNYGGRRASPVEYLVVHYTAVPGDTAENEGRYFARNDTGKTSAHYFVDEREAVRSVPEDFVAWHCGGREYFHDHCRNGNSIGIEICTKGEPGDYRFDPRALHNAQTLLRQLMAKYQVPPERVLRHYDVTRKLCPMPFVGQGQKDWETFKGGLKMYQKTEQLPDWAKETVQKLVDRGALQGDGEGNLNLSEDMVRLLVILDRMGTLK